MLIAQLSDPHVRPRGRLYQDVVDSNAQFAAAIAAVNKLDPRPDLVLLSGDLVDHGAADEYAMLGELLVALEVPLLAIPGNHDDREAFRRAFAGRPWLPASGPIDYVVGDGGVVRIVAVDVTLPGLHHGVIGEEKAAWLDGVLAADPRRPTVVMMHQPPFDTGIPYLDLYSCREGQRLADVVRRHPQVEKSSAAMSTGSCRCGSAARCFAPHRRRRRRSLCSFDRRRDRPRMSSHRHSCCITGGRRPGW